LRSRWRPQSSFCWACSALSGGWRDLVRPLVADYVDRLGIDIGSPPDVARAQTLTTSDLGANRQPRRALAVASARRTRRRTALGPLARRQRVASRTTADGHRITFGTATSAGIGARAISADHARRSARIDTRRLRLYAALFRPIEDIGAAPNFGRGDFSQPIAEPRLRLAGLARASAMARDLEHMLEPAQPAVAISHELRSPLTRARLNAELVADSASATCCCATSK
jgi:signal transduction histidine kinase